MAAGLRSPWTSRRPSVYVRGHKKAGRFYRPAWLTWLARDLAGLAVEDAPLQEVQTLPLDQAEQGLVGEAEMTATVLRAERTDAAVLDHPPIPVLAAVVCGFTVR